MADSGFLKPPASQSFLGSAADDGEDTATITKIETISSLMEASS
jgi:hypothetical protein